MSETMKHLGCVIVSSLKPEVEGYLSQAVHSVTVAAKNAKIRSTTYIISNSGRPSPTLEHQPDEYIHVKKNQGFGQQNNQAIHRLLSKTRDIDYLLLLNDDAWLEPTFLKKLETIIEKNQSVDVVIPLIYKGSGKQHIDAFGMEIFQSGYAHDSTNLTTPTCWGTAACIIFSISFVRNMINTFGYFFNPMIYFYYEDVELKMRAESRKPLIIKDSSLVAHHMRSLTSGTDSDFTIYQTMQSYLWMVILSWPKKTILKNGWRFLLIYTWLTIHNLLEGKFSLLVKVVKNTTINFTSLLRARHHITRAYPVNFDPSQFLSPYLFRTRKKQLLIK